MKFNRISWWLALLAALFCSCGHDEPTAPGLHTISGHVKLTGYLVNANGDFAGTRVVGDADGVPVELLFGDQVVARTTTVDGVYAFHGMAPGAYVARTGQIGPIHDETNPLTIARSDVRAGDTLRLASLGDLFPVPNPAQPRTTIYFYLADTARVEMHILDMAGNPVFRVVPSFQFPPGLWTASWDGRNEGGRQVPDGMYWVLFRGRDPHAEHDGDVGPGIGDDLRVQLLFR